MKKHRKFGILELVVLTLIVLVVATVPTLVIVNQSDNLIEENFVGQKSEFQGIITIWNVDTFESGIVGKSVFLENASTEFSKENPGLYFLVRNITVEEMMSLFLEEQYPDIISFGAGLGNIVKPILSSLNLDVNIREEIKSSSQTSEGETLALGILMGGYILASTPEKLANAGLGGATDLKGNVNNAGFDKETKRGLSHTPSVVYGKNNYINTPSAVLNGLGVSLADAVMKDSMYDAYLEFVAYNAGTILLGTHRDLFKLSGKVAVGKLDGLVVNYIEGYTNLVQYIGIVKSIHESKLTLASSFIEYLFTDEVQESIKDIGLFSVQERSLYSEGEFRGLEEALSGELVVPNIFT